MENPNIFKSREVQLTLCENCNLNCVYCYEHSKGAEIMNLSVAKSIIEHEFLLAEKDGINNLCQLQDDMMYEFFVNTDCCKLGSKTLVYPRTSNGVLGKVQKALNQPKVSNDKERK